MTNGELLQLYETLNRLTANKDLRFSVKVGYYFNKNKAAIREDAKLLYQTRRQIMLEFGELQDNGDIIIKKDYLDEMEKKLDEIMSIQNNIQIMQIDINDFDECKLNIEDIEGLMPMLSESWVTGPPIFEKNTGV